MRMTSSLHHLALGALLLAAIPATARAQDTTLSAKDMTQAQYEMNQRGLAEVRKGTSQSYRDAADLFRASIKLGEWNITYLNLGRTYQRMIPLKGEDALERCVQAEDAFRKALAARPVPSPPPAEISARVKQFRAELQRDCPAELTIVCSPPEMKVLVNLREQGAQCGGKPLKLQLKSGEYVVEGVLQGESVRRAVKLEPMDRKEVGLKLVVVKAPVVTKDPSTKDPTPKDPTPKDPSTKDPIAGKDPASTKDPKDTKAPVTTPSGVGDPATDPVRASLNPNGNPNGQTGLGVGKVVAPVKKGSNAVAWTMLLTGTAMVVGGAVWDTCAFQRGALTDERAQLGQLAFDQRYGPSGPEALWCHHTVNNRFDKRDVGPAVLYAVGGIFAIIGAVSF